MAESVFIGPGDRLSFTLFLAVALHAAVIFGVTFVRGADTTASHTMEVTLAQQPSRHRPERSDFLAQFDQTGSGRLEEKALTTAPSAAKFHDNDIRKAGDGLPVSIAGQSAREAPPVVTTTSPADDRALPPSPKPAPTDFTFSARAFDIASLEARLDRQKQHHARRPRVKRLTSLATRASADAFYLHSWRRKIETIGNLNYPAEARKNKLYGSLRLLVAIAPDGSLKEIELLESSGHKVLDEAAVRIARLAAPYAPFPDELRQTTDVLEIIRTWQFRKNASLRSY